MTLEGLDRAARECACSVQPVVHAPRRSSRNSGPSRPFEPSQNVIAYWLWGRDHRCLGPLLENLRILPHSPSGWTLRPEHDATVPPEDLGQPAAGAAQLLAKTPP